MKIDFTSPITNNKETINLEIAFYGDGSTALTSTYFDEEFQDNARYETFSVNLTDYFIIPEDEFHVFIKDYSEGEGNIDELEKHGIVNRDPEYFLADDNAVVTFGPFRTEAVYVEIVSPELRQEIENSMNSINEEM